MLLVTWSLFAVLTATNANRYSDVIDQMQRAGGSSGDTPASMLRLAALALILFAALVVWIYRAWLLQHSTDVGAFAAAALLLLHSV